VKNVVIVGYFGDNNLGDEAILGVVLQDLRMAPWPVTAIVPAYGSDPAVLERTHANLRSFMYTDVEQLLAALEGADLVLLCGGLLHDIWRPHPETMLTAQQSGLAYYCGTAWLAGCLGKPVMFYGIGVGPLRYPEGQWLVRLAAGVAWAVTVRDAESAALLRGLGYAGAPPQITADPTWQLEPAPPSVAEQVIPELRVGQWIGVALRNWNVGVDQAQWETHVADAIEDFSRERQLGVVLIPFQHGRYALQDDVGLARRVASRLRDVPVVVLDRWIGPHGVLAVLARLGLVVAMRLHAFIFSCIAGTPTVAVSYDAKVAHHARMLGADAPVVELENLSRDGLYSALCATWDARTTWAARAQSLARTMRDAARRNGALALELLAQEQQALPRASCARILDMLRARAAASAVADRTNRPTPPWRVSYEGVSTSLRGRIGRVRRDLVRVVAPRFFDPWGSQVVHGGAERYLLELVRVLGELEVNVEVVQPAGGTGWERTYRGMRVVGVAARNAYEVEVARLAEGGQRAALTVHLAFFTAGRSSLPPAIGVSHGVYWDHAYYQAPDRWRQHQDRLLESLEHLDLLVSVDAQTINWVRTVSSRLAERCIRVPNFVDVQAFSPVVRKEGPQVVLLFPRRLAAARGFWLMVDLLPSLLADIAHVDAWFVGDPEDEAAEQAMRRMIHLGAGRVRWDVFGFDGMPQAYAGADIVAIPSVASEGTSLSCLEALACGKAVIATHVGGLPEIVVDGYNGLLVEPDAAAVRGAVERLAMDAELRRRLGQRAVEVAQAFDITRWRERWKGLLRTFLL
jgi:polysaccharide pyruvyl transferase CsaB